MFYFRRSAQCLIKKQTKHLKVIGVQWIHILEAK